jgi:hypothetical protein
VLRGDFIFESKGFAEAGRWLIDAQCNTLSYYNRPLDRLEGGTAVASV